MKTMTVGEFKTKFSSVLDEITKGKSIAIGYGRNRDKVAVLVPWEEYAASNKPKPGLLNGRASFKFKGDGKITDAEFLAS